MDCLKSKLNDSQKSVKNMKNCYYYPIKLDEKIVHAPSECARFKLAIIFMKIGKYDN